MFTSQLLCTHSYFILDTKCTTLDDVWKEAKKCSVLRRSDVPSCSLPSNGKC